jgi:hypothetical protein
MEKFLAAVDRGSGRAVARGIPWPASRNQKFKCLVPVS